MVGTLGTKRRRQNIKQDICRGYIGKRRSRANRVRHGLEVLEETFREEDHNLEKEYRGQK